MIHLMAHPIPYLVIEGNQIKGKLIIWGKHPAYTASAWRDDNCPTARLAVVVGGELEIDVPILHENQR